MQITTTPDGIQTISSLEIAKITGKKHSDVMRDIRNTLEQAEIVESKFAGYYIATNGKQNPCYLLPREMHMARDWTPNVFAPGDEPPY